MDLSTVETTQYYNGPFNITFSYQMIWQVKTDVSSHVTNNIPPTQCVTIPELHPYCLTYLSTKHKVKYITQRKCTCISTLRCTIKYIGSMSGSINQYFDKQIDFLNHIYTTCVQYIFIASINEFCLLCVKLHEVIAE